MNMRIISRRSLHLLISGLGIVIVILSFALVVLPQREVGAAGPEQVTNLQSAVADAGYTTVAVLDAATPIPQMDKKDSLFVDGKYFMTAGDATVDEVIAVLEEGKFVVFFGGGYERIRDKIPNMPYTETRVKGTQTKAPTVVEGVSIKPGQSVNGKPVGEMFTILGTQVTTAIISQANDMAKDMVQETEAAQAMDATTALGYFGNPGPDWIMLAHYYTSSGNAWYPYGQEQTDRYYFCSSQLYDSGHVVILAQERVTMVPGNVAWGSGWGTADLWQDVYLDYYHPNYDLKVADYDPISSNPIPGGSYTIGLTLGPFSASWTGSITSTTIHDQSSPYYGRCDWWVDLPQSTDTRRFDAGLIWIFPTGYTDDVVLTVQGQWSKSHWYGNEYKMDGGWVQWDGY